MLIGELVRHDKTVTILPYPGYNSSQDIAENEREENQYNGKGANVIVESGEVAFDFLVQDPDGNIKWEKGSVAVVLGHELIHAWRGMDGNQIPYETTGEFWYDDVEGKRRLERAPSEELQTTGIIPESGYVKQSSKKYPTENALRKEQGMNKRVSYKATNRIYRSFFPKK